MASPIPKQFLSLEGVPIFVHTLRKLVACQAVDEIYLGLRAEDKERAQNEIERDCLSRPVRLVEGGPSRQETVARCLDGVSADAEVVLVHDAVRPFIELEMIPARSSFSPSGTSITKDFTHQGSGRCRICAGSGRLTGGFSRTP